MSASLTEEAFCRSVERWLRRDRAELAVQVEVRNDVFVVHLQLRDLAPRTWTCPVAEPAYDPAVGDSWSEDQAYYLALLAAEENLVYVYQDQQTASASTQSPDGSRSRRGWWRKG